MRQVRQVSQVQLRFATYRIPRGDNLVDPVGSGYMSLNLSPVLDNPISDYFLNFGLFGSGMVEFLIDMNFGHLDVGFRSI